MYSKEVLVCNQVGLHAMATFLSSVNEFKSDLG